jgi:hypothetical protein
MNISETRREVRMRRLTELTELLAAGCLPLTLGELRSVLTARELEQYRQSIATFSPVPVGWEARSLSRYKAFLREADRLNARAMKLRLVGPEAFRRVPIARAAQKAYARAIETAAELVGESPRLAILFDREVTENTEPDETSTPRPQGSRSEHAMPKPRWITDGVLGVQLKALLDSLDVLRNGPVGNGH